MIQNTTIYSVFENSVLSILLFLLSEFTTDPVQFSNTDPKVVMSVSIILHQVCMSRSLVSILLQCQVGQMNVSKASFNQSYKINLFLTQNLQPGKALTETGGQQ